jgi:hypothetical protein
VPHSDYADAQGQAPLLPQGLPRVGELRGYCALAVSSNSFKALGLMFAQIS